VVRPGHDRLVFALVVKGEQATLQVRQKDSQQVVAQSPAFPCALPRDTTTELMFAHVDDQLIAWRDGEELQRFVTDEFAVRDGCVLPTVTKQTPNGDPYVGLPSPADAPDKLSLPLNQKVTPQLAAAGSGELRITDLRIDRDQHYTCRTGSRRHRGARGALLHARRQHAAVGRLARLDGDHRRRRRRRQHRAAGHARRPRGARQQAADAARQPTRPRRDADPDPRQGPDRDDRRVRRDPAA
jgi:hypothetical protein